MSHPIVIDVIGRDRTGAAMKSAAESQKNLAKQIDATNKSNDNLRKSQLGLIAAQERYNKVAKDTGSSVGQLASAQKSLIGAQQRVSAETRKMTAETEKFGKTADKAHGQFKPLLDSALLLGPAIVPIGAGAVAAGAGLAGLGAAGVLAFKGIQREMKQNTALGKQYEAAFAPIVTEYGQLQHIAAAGVFDGVNRGIKAAQTLFPSVNTEVARLSVHLGNIGGNVGAAFVNVFKAAEPLFSSVATYLDKGSGALLRWSQNSGGVQTFVAYALKELPVVEKTIENVATAIGHIVQAAVPIGEVVTNAISGLASAIAKIPVPVLTGLLAALGTARLISITSGFGALAGLFTGVGATAAGAATGVGLLAVATGLLADKVQNKLPQIGVNISKILSDSSKANKSYSDSVNTFGSQVEKAFEQGGKGALKLAQQAALAATQLGPVQRAIFLTGQSTASFAQALTGTDSGWKLFLQNVRDGSRAAGDSSAATQQMAGDLNRLRDQFLQGKITGEQMATALKQLGIDASTTTTQADLLKASLDKLNGVALTSEAATIAYNQAVLSLTTDLGTNKDTTNLATQAGISNRQNVVQAIKAAEDQAIAVTGATTATVANTSNYRTNIKALLDRTATANGDKTATDRQKDAVYQLILQLSGYNKLPVPPKPISVPTKAALDALGVLQQRILGLVGKTVVVELDLRSGVSTGGGGTAIGGHPAATGGYIYGPGTKTSDSVPILASAGEFMVRADAVSKYGLGFMRNLNAMKFAAGGPIVVSMPNPAIVASQASTAESSAANAWARNNMAALASQFGGAATVGGNLGAWIAAALAVTGTPAAWGAAIQRRIMFESGGNPNAINLWDSNAMAGDPSRGLMQTIGSTFAAYHQAGTSGNIYDPVANIAAAINYIKSRYGSIFAIDPPVQGYRTGAWEVASNQLAGLHKGEMVLPADIAELVRSGVGKGLSPRAIAVAVAEALAGMEFRFDGDGLARLVTSRQTAYAVRGGRR